VRVVWRGETRDNGNTLVCWARITGYGWRGELADVHGDCAGEWPSELATKCMRALTEDCRPSSRYSGVVARGPRMSDVDDNMKKLASAMKGERVPEGERWDMGSSDVSWSSSKEPHSWVVIPLPPPPTHLDIAGVMVQLPLKRGVLARLWLRLRIWWAMRKTKRSRAVFNKTRSG